MAGTLTISTLSDGTNSTSSTNCIKGSAKAWVNFNGTTSTIRASYNVSSVTNTATGEFTVNFTNAFADTNYCWVVSGQLNGTGNTDCGAYSSSRLGGTGSWTTTALKVTTQSNANITNENALVCNVTVFR